MEVCQFQRLNRVVDVPVAVRQERSAQVQFVDKNTVVVPVVMQRLLPVVQNVQETVEVPQVQYIAKVVNVTVLLHRQVPTIRWCFRGLHRGIIDRFLLR